ncbi:MAG: indole-3-glycerol phosphate synthase TrpC, partial [Planctomycetota bacterium]|nr:indole-3-glycerol phosphate synthase TrpC [Planctomycetota bacterium]
MSAPLPHVLARIVRTKEQEVERLLAAHSAADLRRAAAERLTRDPPRPFRAAVSALAPNAHLPNIIAEIKKASPSAGVIRSDFDPGAIASAYARGGAAAISCLTDRSYFQGDIAYLQEARQRTALPVLRKDFIIHPAQICEASAIGADAVLLIARLLTLEVLRDFLALCRELRLAALVEIHDEADLDKALAAAADLIGVNNRDLDTFSVDKTTALRLRRLIPKNIPVVAESGISTPEDLRALAEAGIEAVLVGEALMR